MTRYTVPPLALVWLPRRLDDAPGLTPLFGMKVSRLGGDRAGAPWWWLSARGAVLVWHALASLASIQILASSATDIDYPLPEKKA
ncbi:hypothetical protein [Halomonas casei]|uniref:hypothetical protein n=1 Tax=Halomonas casei TaxID=2742613 RepID=UPI003CFAF3A9